MRVLKYLSLFTLLLSINAQANIAIIAHKESPISQVSQQQLQRIYLGKVKAFENGSLIAPLEKEEGLLIRNNFQEKVLQRNDSQLYSYWARMLFTGRAIPPRIIEGSDKDTLSWVRKDKHSIAYINEANIDNTVKVLLIIQ